MKHIKDFGFIAACLGVAILIFNFFVKDRPSDLLEEPLQETEASRVVIEDRKISVLSRKGTKAAYVPSSGHVVVSTKKDGQVDIKVKQAGFSLQAGLGGVYADTGRLTLDLQCAYYRRIGFHLGVGFADARPTVSPYAAVSYRLDAIRLANTSLVAGMTFRKEPLIGIRVEL
jgi:hypothetical protein